MRLPFRINFVVDAMALAASSSVGNAKKGDFRVLVRRLRSRAALSDEEREFLALNLEGDAPRAANRPPNPATQKKRDEILVYVHVTERLSGYKRTAIVAEAARYYGVQPRYVWDVLSELKNNPEKARIYAGMFDMAADLARNQGSVQSLPVKNVPLGLPDSAFGKLK